MLSPAPPRRRSARAPRRARRQHGVGLLEVLVAMLVLAVGFLAAGAMQVRAMRDNQDAYHESQAQLLLADMVDRMRNNPAGVRANAYASANTASLTIDLAACRTGDCGPAALAASDLSAWAARLSPTTAGVVPILPPSGDTAAAIGKITARADGVHELSLEWRVLVDGALVARVAKTTFVP